MHIVVSWDISDGPNRTDINDQLVAVLKPYPWVSLIVSPSMAGMYAGTLPKDDWDKINQITA
jgi:hypothetical protein